MIQMTQAASLLVTQNLVIDVTLRRMSKMMKHVEHTQEAFSKIFMERNRFKCTKDNWYLVPFKMPKTR